ncbi:MAG: hydrogen gas-evolving membrane-bound hydrogenase subunit E [Gammaproteobacteria bacterium]
MKTDLPRSPAAGSSYLVVALLPLAIFLALVWGLATYPLPWRLELAWVPSLDLTFSLYVDGLSALMLALVSGIGSLVFVYASGYLAHEPRRGQLFLYLSLFLLTMLGAVSADHLLVLFLFWELTSLLSFLLVGFNHEDADARSGARQALFITLGGGLALLAGFILLAQMAGSWSLQGVLAQGPELVDDPRLPAALGLIFLGAFTKSAQFPFHFWLPNAMAAPTPVSAYLHSATLVKLGIYLLARLDPAFNDVLLWEATLIGIGALTAVWAAVQALRERDLKRILARTTVSALGTLTLLVGLPNPGSSVAVTVFLFSHALYKAPLFMVVGNIRHATGTQLIDRLMGLRRAMPWTAAIAILASLSMAGLPLSFGFVAKDLIVVAKAEADLVNVVSYALVLVNAIAVAVAGVAAIRVFWGPEEYPRVQVREAPWSMRLPPLLIALAGLEFEFLPERPDSLLAAALAISPEIEAGQVSASYELGTLITAAEITLALGLVLFLVWDRLHHGLDRVRWLERYGPAVAYERALQGLVRTAAVLTRWLQHGHLAGYTRLILVALLGLGVAGWLTTSARGSPAWDSYPQSVAWLAATVLMLAAAVAAACLRDRLALIMASGLVGYGGAVLFLFAGAPDLAFTQFAVETVLVVVAASILPHFRRRAPPIQEPWLRNGLIAGAAGLGTLALLLHLAAQPTDTRLADWFAQTSLPEALGRNVVNVILVDFRALDTLGEIAVVAFSLLAALPLLAGLRQGGRLAP